MRNRISAIKFLTVFILACFFVSGVAGPSWGEAVDAHGMDKSFLGLYGGSIGLSGIELNLDGGMINPKLDGLFYSSLFTRKRKVESDPYVLGLEIGVRICNSQPIGDTLSLFSGLGLGFDIYSSGGPGFMFGPTESETSFYLSPSVGSIFNLGRFRFFGEMKQIIYSFDSFSLVKLGVGLN